MMPDALAETGELVAPGLERAEQREYKARTLAQRQLKKKMVARDEKKIALFVGIDT